MIVKTLKINEINIDNLSETSEKMDLLGTFGKLEFTPWTEFPYKPDVHFRIASLKNQILLKFYVSEKEIRSEQNSDNSAICQDSCVEFFIIFKDSRGYYNFEFNSKGFVLGAYGISIQERENIDLNTLKLIKRYSRILSKNSWELLVIIPSEVFIHHSIDTFFGLRGRANFYKCGDLLEEPHYLAWSDIKSEYPDFHRSEFFRDISFQ